MHPTLVYLYIHDIDRCLKREEFTFTNDFIVDYDYDNRSLKIKRNENNPYIGMWGEWISNINLIVGKNGSGKSTVLDLLGSNRNNYGYNSKWFAIYHNVENLFTIEGQYPGVIKEVENSRPAQNKHGVYSMQLLFDFENLSLRVFPAIYSPVEKQDITFLYQSKDSVHNWFKKQNRKAVGSTSVCYERHYLQPPSYGSIYLFMSREYMELERVFTINNAVLSIRKASLFRGLSHRSKTENFEEMGFQLYQGRGEVFLNSDIPIYDSRDNKQMFIVTYLEGIILLSLLDYRKRSELKEKLTYDIAEMNTIPYEQGSYNLRVNYLIRVLSILRDDSDIYEDILRYLEYIDDEFFTSNSELKVPISQGEIVRLREFINFLDGDPNHDFKKKPHYLNISFENMSTGELDFIHNFSSVYNSLKQLSTNTQRPRTIILMLDEPDASFHPEWSRRYIHYLKKCISLAGLSYNTNLQIILTTHSPFVVSDIPKEHITCINVTDDLRRIVKKADFGLMGNLYDIVKNDFFLDSPVGEFAKHFFTATVKRINDWKEYDKKEIGRIDSLIKSIDEPVIRSRLQECLNDKSIELRVKQEVFDTEDDLDNKISAMERELQELKERRRRKH